MPRKREKPKRDWVKVAEVAEALDVHRATVLLWITTGKIEGAWRVHDSANWRIPRAWLLERRPDWDG